jgi:hypothetical protein
MGQGSKFILATSALFLCSCGTLGSAPTIGHNIVNDAITLNEAYSATTNAVILKNILRARDRWPTTYTTLSGIKSTPRMTRGSDLSLNPLGLGNPVGPLKSSTSKFTNSSTAFNDYSINPFASDTNSKLSILQPTNQNIFIEYFGRWPRDVVTLMFVNGLTYEENVGSGDVRDRIIHNDGEDMQGFINKLAEQLGVHKDHYSQFSLKHHLDIVKVPKAAKDCQTSTKSLQSVTKDYVEMVELLKKQHSGDVTLKSDKGKAKNLLLSACSSQAVSGYAFALRNHPKHILQSGNPAARVSFELRSFDSMVYFIGETLRKPNQYVVDTKCPVQMRNEYNQPLIHRNGSPAITEKGPLFKIFSSFDVGYNSYAAGVRHDREMYYAVPNDMNARRMNQCLSERSSTALSILSQLLLINQNPKALESPESLFVR